MCATTQCHDISTYGMAVLLEQHKGCAVVFNYVSQCHREEDKVLETAKQQQRYMYIITTDLSSLMKIYLLLIISKLLTARSTVDEVDHSVVVGRAKPPQPRASLHEHLHPLARREKAFKLSLLLAGLCSGGNTLLCVLLQVHVHCTNGNGERSFSQRR